MKEIFRDDIGRKIFETIVMPEWTQGKYYRDALSDGPAVVLIDGRSVVVRSDGHAMIGSTSLDHGGVAPVHKKVSDIVTAWRSETRDWRLTLLADDFRSRLSEPRLCPCITRKLEIPSDEDFHRWIHGQAFDCTIGINAPDINDSARYCQLGDQFIAEVYLQAFGLIAPGRTITIGTNRQSDNPIYCVCDDWFAWIMPAYPTSDLENPVRVFAISAEFTEA